MTYFFSWLTLVLLLFYTVVVTGEIHELLEVFRRIDDPDSDSKSDFLIYLFWYAFLGNLYTISLMLCVTVSGPISYNLTQIIKDVLLTYVGFIFFDDSRVT